MRCPALHEHWVNLLLRSVQRCHMYSKQNRFYADWRDKKGKRHRKAFTTANEATRYELEQKARYRSKTQGTAQQSQKPSVPTTQRGSSRKTKPGLIPSMPRKTSSPTQAANLSATLRPQTLQRSSGRGTTTRKARGTPVALPSSASSVGSQKSMARLDSTTRSRKSSPPRRAMSQQQKTKETPS